MREFDEKRDYIRMNIDCALTYKLADSDIKKTGRCISLSGSGISFITDSHYDTGLAMEVNILPVNSSTPPMTAFIETVRCTQKKTGSFEIAASIKSLK